jgi:nicotinate phosphoribosyltransferase
MRGVNAFTADVVLLEDKPCAKVGRRYSPNPRLELVKF